MILKKQDRTVPVYMINGFLESGKTQFLKFTLAQPYFKTRGTTLLICCEEGEEEYDTELLAKTRTVMEVIDDFDEFTKEKCRSLEEKYKPERIVIEWNGMWNYKEMKLPNKWEIEQQITMIDASTFQSYFTNMRSLLAEMLRNSEMIIFNRCDGLNEELPSFRRNIKALNPKADVIFEDSEGEINQIFEEDLPYDLNADVIELDNPGYGMWYLDSMDNLDRYIGKTVKFTAMVLKPKSLEDGYFVPGRMAMTCCADDMAFLGFTCHYENASSLKEKQWIEITAKIGVAERKEYNGEAGPLLEAISVESTKAPKEPVISFT